MGTQLPSPTKGQSSLQFLAHFSCGQTAGCIKMPLGMEVGLSPGDCVRWGPSYPQKKSTPTPTQFLAHVYCGQTAGWMNTPLRTEVDLGTGHVVLDVVPAVRERGTAPPPSLRLCLLWPRSPISATAELLFYNLKHVSRYNVFILECFFSFSQHLYLWGLFHVNHVS